MEFFLGYLVTGVLFGLLTKYLASNKGYDGGFWWGFFLGIIGVIVVGLRRDISSSGYQPAYNSNTPNPNYLSAISSEEPKWTCYHCGSKNASSLTYCINCRTGKDESQTWVCSCGTKNLNRTNCRACGMPHADTARTAKQNLENANTDWVCLCGTRNLGNRPSCWRCGKSNENLFKQESIKKPAGAAENEENAMTEAVKEPAAAAENEEFTMKVEAKEPIAAPEIKATWSCSACEQVNVDEAKFCMACGTKRPPDPAADWGCTDCGKMNSNKGQYCIECGSKRPG